MWVLSRPDPGPWDPLRGIPVWPETQHSQNGPLASLILSTSGFLFHPSSSLAPKTETKLAPCPESQLSPVVLPTRGGAGLSWVGVSYRSSYYGTFLNKASQMLIRLPLRWKGEGQAGGACEPSQSAFYKEDIYKGAHLLCGL